MAEKKLSKKHINVDSYSYRFFFCLKIFTYTYSICIFFKELIPRSLKLEEKLNKTPSYGKHSSRSVVHFQMHIESSFTDLNSFKT